MLDRLKELSFFDTFRNISTYFSAQVAIQALGIISLPVFTYFMTTEEYGIVNVYMSLVLVFTILLGANLHGAVSRYYYEQKKDFPEFLGTSIISMSIVFLIGSSILFWFRSELAELINLPEQVFSWLILFSYLSAVYSIFLQVFIPQKKAKLVSVVQVLSHYGKFAFIVLGFLIMVKQVYMGKIIGETIAMVFISFYLMYKISPFIEFTFIKTHLKYILNYSIPLIPFILSGYILHSFDQWYINAKLGNADAGLYSFAYKIGMLLAGFITALLDGSNPNYYKWMNEKQHDKVNLQIISLSKLLIIATAFLILFAIDIGTVLALKKEFHEALPLVPIIVAGYFLYGLTQFYYRGIYFQKRNIYLTLIVLLGGILNIILNSIYIPIYGYAAAAYTTLVSYLFMLIITILTTKYLKLPDLPILRILVLSSYLLALIGIYYLFIPKLALDLIGISLKVLLFISLGILLFGKNLSLILKSK